MSDLPSRLRASVKMGAVGGTSAEQSVCEKQMLEAASRIATLERNLALVDKALSNTMASALALESQLAERTRERDEWKEAAHKNHDKCASFHARAESAEKQVRELREALRNQVIQEAVIYDDELNEETVMCCNCCDIIWRTDQPELHAPNCLVARVLVKERFTSSTK